MDGAAARPDGFGELAWHQPISLDISGSRRPALRELARVVKPGGPIRLLEYVRPAGTLRRVITKVWAPWVAWAYGASFDRHTESHVAEAGLELVEARFVVDDLIKLIAARVPTLAA